MSTLFVKILESINSAFQSAVLGAIFVFKSNIYQIGSIFEKILAPIFFPLVIIPDAITSLFSLYHFVHAKNKNLGKTVELIHAPIKTALVFTAVFAGLSLLVVQGLFLTAVGSSVVYHLGLSILHAYHWLKSEKNSHAKLFHKNHTLNNLITAIIGGIAIAGIVLTMVVAPYLVATLVVVAGVTTANLLILTTVFAIYRNFQKSSPYPTINPNLANEKAEALEGVSSSTSTLSTILNTSQPHQNTNYYHRECPLEEITIDFKKNKGLLLSKIAKHKAELEHQIEKKELFWVEKPKRQEKINLLKKFEWFLKRSDEEKTATQRDFIELIQSTPNNAYQSFFKDKGKVESIKDAVEKHFDLLCKPS